MPRSVFISSTGDLKDFPPPPRDYREKARDAVLKTGLHPVMMEYFASSGAAPPLEQCLKSVEDSDVVVVLVAHQYGWVPPEQVGHDHKSITWLECEKAASEDKEVLAFILADDFPWPDNLREESAILAAFNSGRLTVDVQDRIWRNCEGLKRFKAWLNSRGIRATFTTPEDLEAKVLHALNEWRSRDEKQTRRNTTAEGANSLAFLASYRRQLTDLMCVYYRDILRDEGVVVRPDGAPVLGLSALTPSEPIPLSQLRGRMSLDRAAVPVGGEDGPMVVSMRRQGSSNLFNGLLFRLVGLDGSGRLNFRLGYYFDFLNTSEVLGRELADAVLAAPRVNESVISAGRVERGAPTAFLQNPDVLPQRRRIKPSDFEARCTAFGTCALVVLKRTNQGPQMILNVRSSSLAETPGLLHVIPAGTFQPTMQDDRFLDAEFSLTENLVREFAEELFDDAGISGREARRVVFGSLDDLYGVQGRLFRTAIIHPNKYKLLYLGTVIDPLNLKPEALTVFLLHEGYLQSVVGRDLAPSWETEAGKILLHEFSEERIAALISGGNLVPTGKAHLMLVKKHFKHLQAALQDV
jgi:hypothetical protein